MSSGAVPIVGDRSRCVRCGTELAPHALACPACATLVHAEKLKQLAASADAAANAGDLVRAREHWETALRFLPAESQQHTAICGRVADLTKRIEGDPVIAPKAPAEGSWLRRSGVAIVSVALLLVGKLKFLLLGLTKASTFF